ncbi:glycoside hydrolase family 35 protein [Diplodia corticola]|uniref:Glycoside hydrolase family 35 protein n=1 Tax=Diplodia corticola TaxID=236234 RepID=A0A1J9SF42_9PEZI|nr:glycoside hydrolase family 35 protein [Diplodia corticola]OJD39031.1 glycoside hydrolase family 35 protein [Diplodia corticola]
MASIPHLRKNDVSHQLIVNGKPLLMLAGELQNSSLTSAEYMKEVWPKMVATHVNTVLGCVTWEDIEPEEGRFDFANLDQVVLDARAHGIHLVLLWFGSFKNGLSTYVPGWVKTNPKRFPRAKLRKAGGELATADVLSIFHDEAPKADAKAFATLLEHVKQIDEAHSTVVMVQVENETGLLGDSRDGSKHANDRFAQPVPQDLIDFIDGHWDTLTDAFRANFKPFKTAATKRGTWEDVFGRSKKTDELFMAYHYALYLNRVASAGKAKYPLPLYTNVWQNYAAADADNDFPTVVGGGHEPGDYPSGGAVVDVLDVWQRFAPALDLIAPDVYLNDYASSCAKYRHRNQPLFIPEQRRDEYGARRVWQAFGSHQCLGTSPFGVDTQDPATNPFTRHYRLLDSVSQIVLAAQRRPHASYGFFFDDLPAGANANTASSPSQDHHHTVVFDDWQLTIHRCFVFGQPGPGAGMVVRLGPARFLLVGWGFHVAVRSLRPRAAFTGFLRFEEKCVANKATGELRTLRKLNGDETRSGSYAMMPNEEPDYGGFPICVTVPARTMVAELEVYAFGEEDE